MTLSKSLSLSEHFPHLQNRDDYGAQLSCEGLQKVLGQQSYLVSYGCHYYLVPSSAFGVYVLLSMYMCVCVCGCMCEFIHAMNAYGGQTQHVFYHSAPHFLSQDLSLNLQLIDWLD